MRKLFFTLCLLVPSYAFSLDTSLKGFIALDALNYEKIQRKNGAAVIGIGVLDLKVFAEQDNMTAAIKLNIDTNLGVQNSIFEEAYASYRGIRDWKFTLGKGVVKFQNLHWGAVENTYLDGGSLLGTENSWRKVSNKAFASVAYGHRSLGFLETFTVWGDSAEIKTDERGNPSYATTSSGVSPGTSTNPYRVTGYATDPVTAFSTEKQLGLANKLELYRFENWTFTAGQIYYKNKLADKASYAIDFGAARYSDDIEYWVDLLYGFTNKAPFESYNTYAKNEYFLQAGTQYHFNELWSVVGNGEFLYVKDLSHNYTLFALNGKYYTGDTELKFGQTVKSVNYKFESAVQYKLSKSSFLTMGGLYERKKAELNGVKGLSFIKGVYNVNAEAFKLAATVSFWF